MRRFLKRLAAVLVVSTMVAVPLWLARETLPLLAIQCRLYDLNLRIRGATATRPEILVVAIDEESLSRILTWGGDFPQTTSTDARVLSNLHEWGVAVVGVDRLYLEPNGPAQALTEMGRAERVVWGSYLGKEVKAWAPPAADGRAARRGFLNIPTDLDMFVRRALIAMDDHPSFALAVTEAYTMSRVARRSAGADVQLINHRGPPGTYPMIPYWQVAAGQIAPEILRRSNARTPQGLFEGKIVLIGVTAIGLGDRHPTPFFAHSRTPTSGVEIQATIVDNLLEGDELRPLPTWANVLIVFGAGLVASGAFLFARPWRAACTVVIEMVAVLLGSALALAWYDRVVGQGAPLAAALLTSGVSLALGVVLESREKQRLLAEQNARQREMAKARSLVEALLPDLDNAPSADRLDVCASFRPAENVGGDIFDFLSLGPDTVAVMFADVSGHGISAALVASMIKSATTFLSSETDDPPVLLTRINRHLCHVLPDEVFVAMFFGVIDLKRELITYSNAGHCPLPVVCRPDGQGVGVLDGAGGFVMGVQPDWQYEGTSAPFGRADTLVLCSDGITEGRCRRADGGPLPDKLLGLAARSDVPVAQVVGDVVAWAKRTPRTHLGEDDETVLVIRRK